MRIAALQMSSTESKSQNLGQAHELILEACSRGAQLIALPENFGLMTDNAKQLLREAETLRSGMIVETLQEWAAEYDIWILAGSVPLRVLGNPQKITNSSLLINSDGEIATRYDKIHLFDADIPQDRVYLESKFVKAGSRTIVRKTPFGRLGLSICYDLRFPELYRKLADQKAELIAIPAAFTATTGKAHWDTLTRARAIENQAYVIAPAQTGTHSGGRNTHGHSRIIDPWGRILAERPAGIGVVLAEIQETELNRVRKALPALQHRRL